MHSRLGIFDPAPTNGGKQSALSSLPSRNRAIGLGQQRESAVVFAYLFYARTHALSRIAKGFATRAFQGQPGQSLPVSSLRCGPHQRPPSRTIPFPFATPDFASRAGAMAHGAHAQHTKPRGKAMAKLTKQESRNHQAAMELLEKDVLTDDEKEFVFANYHEGANTINGDAGAFFTPLDLAWEAALELGTAPDNTGRRIIDLCAGIGVLAYTTLLRHRGADVTCIEINPEYVRIGKKLVPEATWICMDVTDVEALRKLGRFHSAISNPPFGRVRTFRGSEGVRYHGGEAEFKVIDVASEIADEGVFIIPQQSSGFQYSGVQCFERRESDKYKAFCEQTGLALDIGMGIDTSFCAESWKGVKPVVELACVDFRDRDCTGEQGSLFEAVA